VRALEADCETPVGVCASFEAGELVLTAYAGRPDGTEWVRDRIAGDPDQPAALGETLAERLLAAGAGEILRDAGVR
jgi:hydroxymethylbilane synthase